MGKIVLTGGGTAGHVMPNIALISGLSEAGMDIEYIGAKEGMEKGLITPCGIPYHGVETGKLRRNAYFSKKNMKDMAHVAAGIREAVLLLKKIKPDLVFSKGGYVAVPVVLGAWLNRIPVIIHESDMTPGLANKIAMPFAKKVLTTFPETVQYAPKKKGLYTGAPIRRELFCGERARGLSFLGFSDGKPVLLIMGGSLGSVKINAALRQALPELLGTFQVAHLCGKGNLDAALEGEKGYRQFEFLSKELCDVLAAADLVVSRAGSNAISELLALKKPNLLIPLSQKVSRGDQILNAKSFSKQGFSMVLQEEEMTKETLLEHVKKLYRQKDVYSRQMEKSKASNGTEAVLKAILDILGPDKQGRKG